jgi:hypothetical protein
VVRKCSRCQKEFTPQELAREESKGMEAERKALGLEGVLFRYYVCSACNTADIFVDVLPLAGESDEAYRKRRNELEATVRGLQSKAEGVEVVLVDK